MKFVMKFFEFIIIAASIALGAVIPLSAMTGLVMIATTCALRMHGLQIPMDPMGPYIF